MKVIPAHWLTSYRTICNRTQEKDEHRIFVIFRIQSACSPAFTYIQIIIFVSFILLYYFTFLKLLLFLILFLICG